MTTWSQPPIAKVYEALSAVADGRVKLTSETSAEVTSSAGDKKYTVRWSPDFREITSNDNATRWQGYAGYPIIAVLLQMGRIDYNPAIARTLAGVPWHALNERFKRNYDAAIEHVLERVRETGGEPEAIRAEAGMIHAALANLELQRPAGKPGKGGKEHAGTRPAGG
jgi:hypothetical protein